MTNVSWIFVYDSPVTNIFFIICFFYDTLVIEFFFYYMNFLFMTVLSKLLFYFIIIIIFLYVSLVINHFSFRCHVITFFIPSSYFLKWQQVQIMKVFNPAILDWILGNDYVFSTLTGLSTTVKKEERPFDWPVFLETDENLTIFLSRTIYLENKLRLNFSK